MFVANDWSIDRATGDIRYIGDAHGGASPSYATVLQFHRAMQDFATASQSVGDDELDITSSTPTDKSTDNIITILPPFNIDQTSAEHLFDGSISQLSGDDVWIGLTVVGVVTDGTTLLVVRDNAFIDSASTPYWGATSSGIALNGDAAANILLRTLIQTRSSGSDIDGQRLRVQAQELGDGYAEFSLTASLGNNTAAVFTEQDLNNQSSSGAIALFGITNSSEGYVGLDVNGDATDEFYYSNFQLNGASKNELYEFLKWQRRRGTAETVYGLPAALFRGVTHEIDIDTPTGTFNAVEPISWSGGTGQLLAIDSPTAGTKLWMQLLTGIPPTDNQTITGGTSSATTLVNVTVITRTIRPSVISSTGTAIIGGFGIGVNPADLGASDQLFDLTNTLTVPPNNVQFSVLGLVGTEDRVLVTNDASGGIDFDQLSLSGALTSATTTSITVATAIPSDTPASGTIRVQLTNGVYRRQTYMSYSGSVFTIPSTDYSGANVAANSNNVFISYIDTVAASSTESFTSVFNAFRTLFIRVRDGGVTPIKTFETTSVLGSGGGSSTVIRTSDE